MELLNKKQLVWWKKSESAGFNTTFNMVLKMDGGNIFSMPPLFFFKKKHVLIKIMMVYKLLYGFLTPFLFFFSSSSTDVMSEMVSFYLGCSFGFEGKLREAGVPVRNVEQGRNVSMYRVGLPLENPTRKHNCCVKKVFNKMLLHVKCCMHTYYPPLFCL